MEDDNLYDEFGNYIGPAIESDGSGADDSGNDSDKASGNAADSDYAYEKAVSSGAVFGNLVMQENNGGVQMQSQGAPSPILSPGHQMMEVDEANEDEEDYFAHGQQIVLHEDKQYYPDAERVFGKDVEALVMEEDAQALDVPIIAPPKQANFQVYERDQLEAKGSLEFLASVS